MKKPFVHIAISFLIASCVYHDIGPPRTWGKLKVFLNNEPWDFNNRYPGGGQFVSGGHYGPSPACKTEYYSVGSILSNADGFERESFFIELAAIPPGTKGRFEITRTPTDGELPCVDEPLATSRFFTLAQDGDVGQDVFDVLESEDNYIEIKNFDAKTLEIKGAFQVTYVISSRSTEPSSLPDTLRFTEGSFETRIF